MNRNYYMVRAMDSKQKDFKTFFENKVVGVGWSEVNFSNFKKSQVDELRQNVKSVYYSKSKQHPQSVGKKLNEVKRFHNINEGDYLIVPFLNSIRLAIAKDKKLYDKTAYELDLANQIRVNYLMNDKDFKTIPRDALSEGLQRRLRVRGSTVSNLYEFKDEIEKIFNKDNYSWTSDYEEKENLEIEKLKKKLLKNIRNGLTNLKTGGIGLEKLVKELFECEEYNANILAKSHFESYGDADVYAVKSDKFQETKILVQAKHHSGYTDNWGLNQLKIIQENSEYQDFTFVLLTTANIGKKVNEEANQLDIITMDGNDLVDWIFEHLDDLNSQTKIGLGISSIPRILE